MMKTLGLGRVALTFLAAMPFTTSASDFGAELRAAQISVTPGILLCVFGALLILIAILGGGFDLKEVKIPKVGLGVRICALLGGLFFIILGIGIERPSHDESEPPHNDEGSQVSFMIYNVLGAGEVNEQVSMVVDGRPVGDLTVDRRNRTSRLAVTVPQEGAHSYYMEASTTFFSDGSEIQYRGVGQGTIYVTEGKTFIASGNVSGSTFLLSLVEGTPP